LGTRPRTLLLDDDDVFAAQVAGSARELGWTVQAFRTPDEALAGLGKGRFDLIALAGCRGAGRTGELVRSFSEAAPQVPLTVFGAADTKAQRLAAGSGGAMLYVPGRPEPHRLLELWGEALSRSANRPQVLLADQDPAFRARLRPALQEAGLEVSELPSARGIFDSIRSAAPRALLIGRGLPGASSLALVRAVRASVRWADVRIIVFAGRQDRGFELEAYRAGVDAVLPKSLDTEDLSARAAGLASRRTPAPEGSIKTSGPEGLVCHIPGSGSETPDVILVQDDPLFLDILQYSLSSLDYRLQAFADGWHAHPWLTALETNGKRPVVIVEPDLPGLECHQLLLDRGCHGTDDLQFVVLSVDASEEAQLLAYSSGATDYVVKPVRLPILLAKVKRLVEGETRR